MTLENLHTYILIKQNNGTWKFQKTIYLDTFMNDIETTIKEELFDIFFKNQQNQENQQLYNISFEEIKNYVKYNNINNDKYYELSMKEKFEYTTKIGKIPVRYKKYSELENENYDCLLKDLPKFNYIKEFCDYLKIEELLFDTIYEKYFLFVNEDINICINILSNIGLLEKNNLIFDKTYNINNIIEIIKSLLQFVSLTKLTLVNIPEINNINNVVKEGDINTYEKNDNMLLNVKEYEKVDISIDDIRGDIPIQPKSSNEICYSDITNSKLEYSVINNNDASNIYNNDKPFQFVNNLSQIDKILNLDGLKTINTRLNLGVDTRLDKNEKIYDRNIYYVTDKRYQLFNLFKYCDLKVYNDDPFFNKYTKDNESIYCLNNYNKVVEVLNIMKKYVNNNKNISLDMLIKMLDSNFLNDVYNIRKCNYTSETTNNKYIIDKMLENNYFENITLLVDEINEYENNRYTSSEYLEFIIKNNFILNTKKENKCQFTNILNDIIEIINNSINNKDISDEQIEEYKNVIKYKLPEILKNLGLKKIRMSKGIFWYGIRLK
jgi:hypothetical protein